MKEIDVIIPVYKPDKTFFTLIDKLEKQTVPIRKIIVMNTEQKYFDRLIYGTPFAEKYTNVHVTHLSKREFNHGDTRNRGVKRSQAPIFVMMTQDALPEDEYLLENLVRPLEKEGTAVSYARQLPAKDCNEMERFTRAFNYPETSVEKSAADVERLGIKAYFCSNACAAYKRDIFDSLGEFVRYTIFNEDMLYAAKAVKAGYSVAYAAQARVIHSHNYTGRQQFHRNFDLGVSQAQHPEVFEGITSEKEGFALVKKMTGHLWKEGYRSQIPMFYFNSACRYAGFALGKNYRKLPAKLILKFTMNKEYWEQEKRIKSSKNFR
jgi:rhamnosyltransferase